MNMTMGKSHIPGYILIMALLVTFAATACNTANEDSPLSLLGEDGKHAAGWVQTHGSLAGTDVSQCETCHGSLNDPVPTGGISGVSCFEQSFNGQPCHGSGESFHPVDWIQDHGAQALPDGSPCISCHGSDLDGGIANVSCYSDSNDGQACHGALGPAFHPTDWLNKSSSGSSNWHADAYSSGFLINGVPCDTCHTPPALDSWPDGKCVQCHFDIDGSNTPGATWTHGTVPHDQFLGTAEADVCVNCHEVNNRFGHGPTFTDCYDCHGVHPLDWADPDIHGDAAKSQPGTDTGFASCQVCHGDDFSGRLARSCSGSGCHDDPPGAPHPTNWSSQSTDTYLHQADPSTDPGNAPVCGQCHLDGSNSPLPPPTPPPPGTPPGCFNNTLCHGDTSHGTPFLDHYTEADTLTKFNSECSQCHAETGPQPDLSARRCDDCHTGGSPYTYTNCRSCHADPPDNGNPVGNNFPNRDGDHGGDHDFVCSECHGAQGSGSGLDHYEPTESFLDLPLSFTRTSTQVTCNGTCHDEDHNDRQWY